MKLKTSFAFLCLSLLYIACSSVNPFTGEKNLALVSNAEILPIAFQQYDQFLETHEVVTGTSEARMVSEVGNKIARASAKYLNALGYNDYLKDYQWEFKLINSGEVNAWALPGGKVVVYTGILPIANSEAMVAAIMGHEIAHALANHGQRRMSVAQLQQLGAAVGGALLEENQEIFATAYGMGTQLGVMLPFSRSNETEADKIGLTLMALSGYDPQAAIDLWKRMKQHSDGQPAEWLSTHPSHDTRIQNLTSWAEEAKSTARKYGVTSFQR